MDGLVDAAARLPRRFRRLRNYRRAFGARWVARLLAHRLLRRRVHALRVPGVRTAVYCRPAAGDVEVLYQIFGDRELDIELDPPPRLIIDGGAHVGYATLFFANKYPDATIVSVEPEASNRALFAKNCREYEGVRLVPGAIWPTASVLSIRNAGATHTAFQVDDRTHEGSRPVMGHSLASLLESTGFDRIDLLKLDIEGAEKEVFSTGYEAWLPKVRTLMIETHDRFREGCSEAVAAAARTREHTVLQRGEYTIFHFL